ncbi:hypothetical protein SAMN05216583_11745 [Selenomonas sp. KH1T6]|nr:hypothetical protein SAMN05216583_11745 [Selenomonas ruminantium]
MFLGLMAIFMGSLIAFSILVAICTFVAQILFKLFKKIFLES